MATPLTPARAETLARLASQKDALTAILQRLDEAGLDNEPPAHMARRYLAKVKHWLSEARFDEFNTLAGLCGDNGYGPGIAATVREGEFYLTRLAPVVRVSETRIAA